MSDRWKQQYYNFFNSKRKKLKSDTKRFHGKKYNMDKIKHQQLAVGYAFRV